MPVPEDGPPVWVRKGVWLRTCPKSYITGASVALLEEFLVRRGLGGAGWRDLSAREAEAFAILEGALALELNNDQRDRSGAFE